MNQDTNSDMRSGLSDTNGAPSGNAKSQATLTARPEPAPLV
jgi:hypothetical protein